MATTEQQDQQGPTDEEQASAAAAYELSVKQSNSIAQAVTIAKRDILRRSGFVHYDTDPPMERESHEPIKKQVWEILAAEAVVTTAEEREKLPIQRLALGSRLLDGPDYGSDEWWDLDVIDRKGWAKAEQKIWNLLDHHYGGTLQRWTRERLPGHVFVKAVDSCFITSEPKYVEQAIYRPETDKLEVLAVSIGTQRALFETQLPALKGQGPSLKTLGTRVSTKADARAMLNGAPEGNSEE